tara:strand:+ start:85932 stop:88094 length:2163 start_codon:yes stop_codon:yes gene_type:complete
MFPIVFISILLFSLEVGAQEVDFDKEFPLSENDLYYPLIGENGELPSEMENASGNAPSYQQPYTSPQARIEDRFVQENAKAIEEDEVESIYEEPSSLGFTPKQADKSLNNSPIKPPASGATSFSIEDLKRTKVNQTYTEKDLAEAEKAVTAMEQTIESLIGANLETETEISGQAQKQDARPLGEFPKLTSINEEDVSSYGIFTQETGGYHSNIWSRINRADVDKFFVKVQDGNLQSTVLREELVKLLLTKAAEPEGESEVNWLAARAKVLQSLGEVSRAGILLSSAGINQENVNRYKNMGQVWVESNLMRGNGKETCPFVRQNILNTDNPFWHRSLMVCQLLSRDLKGLALSTNMLTEKTRRADPLLFALLDTIQGHAEAPMLQPNQKLSPLHSVVYAESPVLLTPNVIPLLSDAVLRRVAKNVTLPLSIRLQAAEYLVNNFNELNDLALLGLLYDKVEFDKSIVESPGVDRYAEEEVDGSLARALLWQGSIVSGLPSTRALTLKALWERAERDGLFHLASKLTPKIRNISADSNLAWLSPEVINRSLKFGDIKTAEKWWETLKENRSLSRELIAKREALKIAFAFIDEELETETFDKWIASKSLYDESDRTEIQRTLTFLEASEIAFPATIWQKLHESMDDGFVDQTKDVSPLWLRLLGSSLEAQNTAGSIMLLSEPLLITDMIGLSEQTAGNIVTGFRFLGMNDIAKKLVLEAVINLK